MPGFNGRGPQGFGPMTGGGRGFCSSRGVASRSSFGQGFGMGRGGGGFGRGFRRGVGPGFGQGRGRGGGWAGPNNMAWGYGPADQFAYGGGPYGANPQDEAAYLRQEADAVRGELDAINRRLGELESQDSQS